VRTAGLRWCRRKHCIAAGYAEGVRVGSGTSRFGRIGAPSTRMPSGVGCVSWSSSATTGHASSAFSRSTLTHRRTLLGPQRLTTSSNSRTEVRTCWAICGWHTRPATASAANTLVAVCERVEGCPSLGARVRSEGHHQRPTLKGVALGDAQSETPGTYPFGVRSDTKRRPAGGDRRGAEPIGRDGQYERTDRAHRERRGDAQRDAPVARGDGHGAGGADLCSSRATRT
jgi:hypothetical protein